MHLMCVTSNILSDMFSLTNYLCAAPVFFHKLAKNENPITVIMFLIAL